MSAESTEGCGQAAIGGPRRQHAQAPGTAVPSRLAGYLFVLGAAAAWGTIGLFYTGIGRRYHLPAQSIAFFRAAVALVALLLGLAVSRHPWQRLRRRDVPLFLGLGGGGVAAFYIVYAYAVQVAGVSVSAVLMYTAPVWITLYAWRFLGEPLDRYRVAALAGALAGAALVAGALNSGPLRPSLPGIALGLGSGLCYGGYTVLNKYAVRHYSPWTVLTWALAIGIPFLALAQPPGEVLRALVTPSLWPWLIALGVGPTVGGGLLYASGLARLPAGVAAVVVSLEPAVAAVLAFLVLGERLAAAQLLGAAMIVASIMLLGCRDLAGSRLSIGRRSSPSRP